MYSSLTKLLFFYVLTLRQWIEKVTDHHECSGFIDAILRMVKDSLLVPESGEQWECSQVCQELRMIQNTLQGTQVPK